MVLFPRNSNNTVFEDGANNNNNNDFNGDTETPRFSEDFDSTCSTPYVSAPSSPGRGPPSHGYFFSAPASPMHFVLSSSVATKFSHVDTSSSSSPTDDFEFSSRFSSNGTVAVGLVRSADELFLNGQIRPIKLASHLQRPQILAPLIDLDEEEEDEDNGGDKRREDGNRRGRDKLKLRSRSVHRKARSLSPLRNAEFQWRDQLEGEEEAKVEIEVNEPGNEIEIEPVSSETTPSCSASTSRSSSTSGRNSKKWISFKDLLYRSKSEGRANGKEKFWSTISFSPAKEKRISSSSLNLSKLSSSATDLDQSNKEKKQKSKPKLTGRKKSSSGRPENGVAAKRRGSGSGHGPSPHELHYTVNRAQAEEMKKRTYLPYRQGLFGCLAFSSKGYSAFNGFTKSLNPVSSR